MQTFFHLRRFSRRIKINSEVNECITGVPVNDRTCNDDEASQKSQRRLKSSGRSSNCIAHGVHVDTCIGGCLQVLWPGRVSCLFEISIRSFCRSTFYHRVGSQSKHLLLLKLPSCQWWNSLQSIIHFPPAAVQLPTLQPLLKTMTFICWIIHEWRREATLPWRVIYTKFTLVHWAFMQMKMSRNFSASQLDLWRGRTEKIALPCPPAPDRLRRRTFRKNQLGGKFLCVSEAQKQCLLNFFSPPGIFPSNTRFNVSFVPFMKILAQDLKY